MTELEKQTKIQELNAEMQYKRNRIQRDKDELTKQKLQALMEATDVYCNEKRYGIAKVNSLRRKKHEFDFDDPRWHEYEEDARQEERHLSLLRTEHEASLHVINNHFAMIRIDLDNEERDLTEWYEREKATIYRQHLESEKQAEQ